MFYKFFDLSNRLATNRSLYFLLDFPSYNCFYNVEKNAPNSNPANLKLTVMLCSKLRWIH